MMDVEGSTAKMRRGGNEGGDDGATPTLAKYRCGGDDPSTRGRKVHLAAVVGLQILHHIKKLFLDVCFLSLDLNSGPPSCTDPTSAFTLLAFSDEPKATN
jgi:hypothetical protein